MQTTTHILLVRPFHFSFNNETAASNAFQHTITDREEVIKKRVSTEFENVVKTLRGKGVDVTVIDDTAMPVKPDAIFPNNWVSFHADGTVILYPMCAPNRRYERRQDIIDWVEDNFTISRVLDLSNYEKENRFLEGTGSIVFDHQHKIAYACLSPRTDKELFLQACNYLKYKPVYFFSHDQQGQQIYHTNVMMCIGKKFAAVCLNSISDKAEREMVSKTLTDTGHELIDISFEQMNKFAGNMLELKNNTGNGILALSQSAYDSLTEVQKEHISRYCDFTPLSITTIETIGGGSARCMIAEVFLKPILNPKGKIF